MRKTGICIAALMLVGLAARASSAQQASLPTQEIVFLVDNSASMSQTDPLSLRGVAAGVILDAAEIYSKVSAGLVHFSTQAGVAAQLGPANIVRGKLDGDRLPEAEGGTNIQAALEAGISLLSGSTADLKKIVLITDGSPDSGAGPAATQAQKSAILDSLAPQAARSGIQIFALGLSPAFNQEFLGQVTNKTGGKTLIAQTHQTLLERAKQLFGDRDNVFTLEREKLPENQKEFEFEIPPGADRARITAILDQPHVFGPSQITLELSGPDPGDGGHYYLVHADDGDWVAAWTSFVSSPGHYKLRVESNKPGTMSHLGMRLFVEALSTLRVDLMLSPAGQELYVFGDEVRADVLASNGSGELDGADFQVSGGVQTPSGFSPITFNGKYGVFKVPDVAGVHEVVVTVKTSGKLGIAERRKSYRASPPDPVELKTSREKLVFQNELGPENATVEESFKVFAVRPESQGKRQVQISATLLAPPGLNGVGTNSIVLEEGATLRTNGAHKYSLPTEGLGLVLRFTMGSKIPLDLQAGSHRGEIRIFSDQASNELVIPFTLNVRVPRLDLPAASSVSLWWDPQRPRTSNLGSISTDASIDNQIWITLPEAVFAPNHGAKIADLALDIDGVEAMPDGSDAGRVVYGPIDVPLGKSVPVRLVVRPSELWENWGVSQQKLPLRVRSSLGMQGEIEPVVWTLGGSYWAAPILGPLSLHGRHLAVWLLVGLALLVLGRNFIRRVVAMVAFRRYRPGATLPLGFGDLKVGEAAFGGGEALLLPNCGGELDDRSIGSVSPGPGALGQVLLDESQSRVYVRELPAGRGRSLVPGDGISIRSSPEEDPLWEMEYIDFDEETRRGEVEIIENPLQLTTFRILRRLFLGVVLVVALRWALSADLVADLSYSFPGIETIYTELLLPMLRS